MRYRSLQTNNIITSIIPIPTSNLFVLIFAVFKKTLFLFRIKYKIHDPRKRRCSQ